MSLIIPFFGGGLRREARVVAFGGYSPNAASNQSGAGTSYDRFETRSSAKIGGQPVAEIRIAWANKYTLNVGGGESNGPAAFTLEAALEAVSPSAVVRATFGGGNTIVVNPGDIVLSDPLRPADFGLSTFAASKAFFVRTGVTGTAGFNIPTSSGISAISGEANKASAAGSSQILSTGALVGANNVVGLVPLAIIGYWAGAPDVSLLINGDSIVFGPSTGKDNGSGSGGVGGWVTAGTKAVNGRTIASVKVARSGDTAVDWSLNNNDMRKWVMQYCSHMVEDLGANDGRASETLANMLAGRRALWSEFRSRAKGAKHILAAHVGPNTDSSDGHATLANQTYFNALFAPGAAIEQLNAAVTADVGTRINAVFPVRQYWCDPTETCKWAVNGVAYYPTALNDGLHPSLALHTLAAAGLNTVASGWSTT